jgi:hypothetical protein
LELSDRRVGADASCDDVPVGLFSFLAGGRKTWSGRNTQRAICGEPVIQALGVPFYLRGD